MASVLDGINTKRSMSAIDFRTASVMVGINRAFWDVNGWEPIQAFSAELKESRPDLDNSIIIIITVHPAGWPENSYIAIETRKHHTGWWEIYEAILTAEHIEVEGLPLSNIHLYLVEMEGFFRVRVKPLTNDPAYEALKVIASSIKLQLKY